MRILRKRGYIVKPDLDALRRMIGEKLPGRAAHILGCEKTAAKLARCWGEDEEKARFAALLHDITKQYSHIEQLKFVQKYDILVDSDFDRFPALAHAVTGAAVARAEYGADEDVVHAIRYHTTGRPGMTKLEKILYLADYIEPSRDFKGLEETRELAYRDLDAAVLRATAECVIYNLKKSRSIHPITIAAYNDMVESAARSDN